MTRARPHVLALFNVLGAATEQTWLDVTLELSRRGYRTTAGYETLADAAPARGLEQVRLDRIQVEPADDVAAQMDGLAARSGAARIDGPVDLVHGHFGPRILPGAAYLRRGVPMIASLYGYDASRLLRDPCWAKRYRWAADHGAVFVVMADAMVHPLLEAGVPAGSIRVIHMGVRPADWTYVPSPAPQPPRFVFIGRLTPKKAPHVLLQALAGAAGGDPLSNATLDVAGDGPLADELRRQAAALELRPRVRFHGAIERRQVAALLREATALVVPSVTAPDGDREGTPIILMEAQALGVPCITTDHSGNGEVLAPPARRECMVPENDPGALSRAMRHMADLPAEARRSLQRAGREWIESQFNLEHSVEQYDVLYRELLDRRARELGEAGAGAGAGVPGGQHRTRSSR